MIFKILKGETALFKRYKHLLALLALLFMLGVALTACAKDTTKPADDNENNNDPGEETEEPAEEDTGPVQGGTITGAMYSAPKGMFNPIFYEDAYDANILAFTHESLFTQNADLEYETNGLAESYEVNDDQTELTVYLRKDVKWHDGEEFTAEDVVFTYQAIADPDYVAAGGVRTNPYAAVLKGYEEYKEGETDEFQGVTAEDNYTVVFHFEEPSIHPLYVANFNIIPKHAFEGIPVAEIPEAAASLQPGEVVGTGPFKFTEMVDREQYVLEKHEDYWQGEPYLDSIVWRVIQQSVMTSMLESGELDFVSNPSGIPPADYSIVDELDHIEIIEQPDFGYQLLGFKINHRTSEDVEAGVINPDNWVENPKLPQEVRQAIAHAIDRQGLIGSGHGEGLLHGRGALINSPIAVQHWAYDEEAPVNYDYDPDKAAEILDEAGFTFANEGDEWRSDPDGNEWTLNFDYPLGNELRERSAPLIKEYLEAVGIQVNMRQPTDMNGVYVPALTNDDSDWDLFLLGWALGTGDPDPLGLWGIEDAFNFARWNNPESDEMLFKAVKAPEAFDQDYRQKLYSEWTTLFSEDLPAILLYAQNTIWAYQDRIHGIDPLPASMYKDPHLWWLEPEE